VHADERLHRTGSWPVILLDRELLAIAWRAKPDDAHHAPFESSHPGTRRSRSALAGVRITVATSDPAPTSSGTRNPPISALAPGATTCRRPRQSRS
jgi:hypothetical protein